MKDKKKKIIFVKCKNCEAKGKIIITKNFDWKVIPCPICMGDELKKIEPEKPLTEKEIDFTFDPTGVEKKEKKKK